MGKREGEDRDGQGEEENEVRREKENEERKTDGDSSQFITCIGAQWEGENGRMEKKRDSTTDSLTQSPQLHNNLTTLSLKRKHFPCSDATVANLPRAHRPPSP